MSIGKLLKIVLVTNLNEVGDKYRILYKKLDGSRMQQRNAHEFEHDSRFYKRVVNLSHIEFSENEINLLSKGLQYNLTSKRSTQWLENLVIETEAAISKLPVQDQEGYRYLVKLNIQKIIDKKRGEINSY
jgi:selenocysteine-specific translation elongation factor